MLHQPIYPHPYLETVDINNYVTFSAVINPKDTVKYYSVQIYDDSTCLYSTGWIEGNLQGTESGTVASCIFPDDFTSTTNGATELVNGKTYYWTMLLGKSSATTDIESPFYHFTTRTAPAITLEVAPVITSCEYTFEASFYQAEDEPYMYYKYSLYRDNELIAETPEKMDSALSYKYDGFIPGNYRIDLDVVASDRQTYTTSRFFYVEYETQPSTVFSSVNPMRDKNCIDIDFSKNIFVKGNASKSITYTTFSNFVSGENIICATVPSGASIYYNKINEVRPLDIGEEFTIYYHVHFDEFFVGDIIKLIDEQSGYIYSVRYDGRKFYYKINFLTEVAIDPYVDSNFIHQEKSVVHDASVTIDDLDYNALYMLYADDVVQSDSVLLYNDMTSNYWWYFVLLPDKVMAYKGEKYSESVVS